MCDYLLENGSAETNQDGISTDLDAMSHNENRIVCDSKELGKRLKECREEAGLAQWKLGMLASATTSFISAVECGRRRLSRQSAIKIAKVLRVRYEYLLGIDNYKTEEITESEAYNLYDTSDPVMQEMSYYIDNNDNVAVII